MYPLIIESGSAAFTRRIGKILAGHLSAGDILLLCGDLGSGKTCFTQGLANGLGIPGYIRSPTFVLISVHRGRLPLYHMDIYRLNEVEEILRTGLEEYLDGDGICVIEWADKAMSIFPDSCLIVNLKTTGTKNRHIEMVPRGHYYETLISRFREKLTEIRLIGQ